MLGKQKKLWQEEKYLVGKEWWVKYGGHGISKSQRQEQGKFTEETRVRLKAPVQTRSTAFRGL